LLLNREYDKASRREVYYRRRKLKDESEMGERPSTNQTCEIRKAHEKVKESHYSTGNTVQRKGEGRTTGQKTKGQVGSG